MYEKVIELKECDLKEANGLLKSGQWKLLTVVPSGYDARPKKVASKYSTSVVYVFGKIQR